MMWEKDVFFSFHSVFKNFLCSLDLNLRIVNFFPGIQIFFFTSEFCFCDQKFDLKVKFSVAFILSVEFFIWHLVFFSLLSQVNHIPGRPAMSGVSGLPWLFDSCWAGVACSRNYRWFTPHISTNWSFIVRPHTLPIKLTYVLRSITLL